ncbi:MAG TPA: prepilin peptidase [bacterium]|nr:prepilin peptidase [bacterium]
MGLIIFIFGLIFGSFANVVILRLPKGKSLVAPGSSCPTCGKSIRFYDNIPLVSYLLLRGKCRFCKKKISARYFLIELLSGILFFLVYKKFGLDARFFIFAYSLLIVGFIDIDTFLISDVIVLPMVVLGLIFSFFPGMHHGLSTSGSFLYSLWGVILGGGLLILLSFFGKLVFKKEAMGGGDVKLLAMIGAFLGWKSIFLTLFFASLLGTLISLSLIACKKKTIEDYVPFGPYLGLGAFISLFYKGMTFMGFFIN